jgi:AcrR family transcriptional regulator
MGNNKGTNPTRRYTIRGVKTRQRLIVALLEIVSTEGMQAASVRAITRRAGCNEAILYQHFRNKEEMLREVFAEIMTRMADEKEGLVEEHPQLTDAVHRWVETTFSFYDRHPDAFAYVLLASPPVVRRPSPLYGRMTMLFGDLMDNTEPPPGKLLIRAPEVLSMFRGLLLGVPRAIHFGSLDGPASIHSETVSRAILRLILEDNKE